MFLQLGDAYKWLSADPNVRRPGGYEWWPDDMDLSNVIVDLPSSDQILSYLRSIPASEVSRMRAAVAAVSERFMYKNRMGSPPGATDTIIELLCENAAARQAKNG